MRPGRPRFGALRRLAGHSVEEALIWIQLVAMGAAISSALRRRSLPSVARGVTRLSRRPLVRRLPLLHRGVDPARLDAIADRASAALPGSGRCLMRSLLILWLIHARGGAASLVVGARREGGRLGGHAWIESDSWPRLDPAEVSGRFPVFLKL